MDSRNISYETCSVDEAEQAIAHFSKALDAVNPASLATRLAVLYQNGMSRISDKQYDDAIQDFGKAIKICKERAYYYWNRYQAFRRLNQDDKATLDFTAMVKFGEDIALYYYHSAEASIADAAQQKGLSYEKVCLSNANSYLQQAIRYDDQEKIYKKTNAELQDKLQANANKFNALNEKYNQEEKKPTGNKSRKRVSIGGKSTLFFHKEEVFIVTPGKENIAPGLEEIKPILKKFKAGK